MTLLSSRGWVTRVTGISTPSDVRLLAGLLIFACWTAFSSCSDLGTEETRQINEALNDSLTSTTEAWEVEIRLMEMEATRARLRGSYAATYSRGDSAETRIRGPVHIEVYDSAGAVTTELRSDRAVYRPATLRFEFFGDVRVESGETRTLRSEYLRWNQGENTISTPRFVVITTPSDTLAGTGLNGTADLENITIREPRGSVTIN